MPFEWIQSYAKIELLHYLFFLLGLIKWFRSWALSPKLFFLLNLWCLLFRFYRFRLFNLFYLFSLLHLCLFFLNKIYCTFEFATVVSFVYLFFWFFYYWSFVTLIGLYLLLRNCNLLSLLLFYWPTQSEEDKFVGCLNASHSDQAKEINYSR